jgi:hypothetical protein
MWNASTEPLAAGRARRYSVHRGGSPIPFADVLHGWRSDESFRAFFLRLLADAPYAACRWETPPLTAATVSRPFEFVLLDAPGLARRPDRAPFADPFRSAPAGTSVATFLNLGRDATLVVPLPAPPARTPDATPDETYVHLASFVRGAPPPQQHALWQAVGAAVQSRLGASPLWLSTAGAGVPWLHVRLDDHPKYYGHRPYAEERP